MVSYAASLFMQCLYVLSHVGEDSNHTTYRYHTLGNNHNRKWKKFPTCRFLFCSISSEYLLPISFWVALSTRFNKMSIVSWGLLIAFNLPQMTCIRDCYSQPTIFSLIWIHRDAFSQLFSALIWMFIPMPLPKCAFSDKPAVTVSNPSPSLS